MFSCAYPPDLLPEVEPGLARFRREMETVGPLEHPHVVEALDAGEHDGVVYLVMKLIEGTDLKQLVQERGPLPVAEACELARQAALGLDYLHRRGLVHRDVKPANLMRTPDGTVKLLDLGLACWSVPAARQEGLTRTGQALGTPEYAAPEQKLNAAEVDGRADLFGLGGTLFYLLTGHAPQVPPDLSAFRSEVPAELANLLRRLLAQEPNDRPSTAAEVADALAAFVPDPCRSSPPRSVPPPTEPSSRRRRRPWLVAGAAGMVVALASLMIVLASTGSRPEEEQPETTDDPPAPSPIEVWSLDVKHFPTLEGQRGQPALLGKKSFETHVGDSVTVEAKLSRPGYAFLIAFLPNGQAEVCFPEKKDEPPPVTDQPSYPSENLQDDYGLEEGEGLAAFALVVSSQPLPSFETWWSGCPASPWQKNAATPGVVWRARAVNDVVALTADNPEGRAKGHKSPGRAPVAQLAGWLSKAPQIETVEVLAFSVLPKDKP